MLLRLVLPEQIGGNKHKRQETPDCSGGFLMSISRCSLQNLIYIHIQEVINMNSKDYKHVAQTIGEFLIHVDNIDPYRDNVGKFDRVIRAVIMAYSHDVRRTESDGERSQLRDLEKAYKTYKNDASIINLFNVIQAYHVITWHNPCVSYRWAVESIYERDHR